MASGSPLLPSEFPRRSPGVYLQHPSETKVKIVNVDDMLKVMELRANLAKSIKHVSFHPSGNLATTVDANGSIRMYSLSTEEPVIIETLSNIVPIVNEAASPISCKVLWHPDGASFAAPSPTREIVVYDRLDWQLQTTFTSDQGHKGPITDIAWSPNGAYLASAAQDCTIKIWDTKSQQIVRSLVVPLYALQLLWHPHQNTISWTTDAGELFTQDDLLPSESPSAYTRPIHRSPLKQTEKAPKQNAPVNGRKSATHSRTIGDSGIEDEALSDDLEDAGAEWIDDDDGAGYIPNLDHRLKRASGYDTDDGEPAVKRAKTHGTFQPQLHDTIQPGSTPWRSQRRYLTLNMVGWVWTVEQDDHNTVTVEFHDRESHRQYHFNDSAQFSFAALNDVGALFASTIRTEDGIRKAATLHYRPHESWASYANWSIQMPAGEDILAIAVCDASVVVCTSRGYIRIYTLHGLPKRVFHSKCMSIVGAIAYGNYVMVLGNGQIRADGAAELVYSIYHTNRDETIQSNDIVALPPSTALRSFFFGDDGYPYIYTNDGLLSVLSKWRTGGQAQWIPVLDTNLLQRRVGKDENYWPVAVSQQKFHCIILKGAERHPFFPRPITSEFDFLVPITIPDHIEKSQASLETLLLQDSILSTLAEDADDQEETSRLEGSIDRSLLQLLNLACKNEQDARALDICDMLKNARSLDAAVKIAGHHSRINLAERIGRISTNDVD